MDKVLQATPRDLSTKATQVRKQGFVPASVYGHDMESTPIQIPYTAMWKVLHTGAIKCEVKWGSTTQLVAIEEVQKNPRDGKIVHVSFHALKSNEKTWMHIPIHLEGESEGKKAGGVMAQQLNEIYVHGYPKDIPDELVIDVSAVELDSSIHVKDILNKFPKLEVSEDDIEKTIVVCHYAKVVEFEPDTTEVEPEVVGGGEATTTEEGKTPEVNPETQKKAA